MRILNLGILAHVDAGKTTLTERFLHSAGVIDAPGRVDAGTTHTDFLPLERARGITIKSAVVNFRMGDVSVNLIDTPGHPDFIAEVERILCTLDGAVLVISAVEGVQPQTRILMRALHRLRIPTVFFVNKIDRVGASESRLLENIGARLTPHAIAMGSVRDIATREADFEALAPDEPALVDRMANAIADHDDSFIESYSIRGGAFSPVALRRRVAALTTGCKVHPLYFGSALKGRGVDQLMAAIPEFLPATEPPDTAELRGTVFKIDRGRSGEKIAYVRMFSGCLNARDMAHLPLGREKVTALTVFDDGASVPCRQLAAGRIGRVWGLAGARIGDYIGAAAQSLSVPVFTPPTLETSVVPAHPQDKPRLSAALKALAEQDPLINLRQDDTRGEMNVSLYGEVQKEVIQATLSLEFDVQAQFRGTRQICVEFVTGRGHGVELLGKNGNPFLATIGLTIEPASRGSGIEFCLQAPLNSLPRYVYKSTDLFATAMREYVLAALSQGIHGWQVTDCLVRMTDCAYSSPSTGARDYRLLTPLVAMEALREAGTMVCEPVSTFRLELPPDALPAVLSLIRRMDVVTTNTETREHVAIVEGILPAEKVHELRQVTPSLTHGEGVLEVEFGGYRPLKAEDAPVRPRTDRNPLNREEYLLRMANRL